MAEKNESSNGDGPTIKAETWFALAFASFLITAVVAILFAIWVFDVKDQAMVYRAQAFAPFGAALLAVVTFLTVAWRGVLNTQQLKHQADQLEQQRLQVQQQTRQNDANEEANLAKLLQEGAKLLVEPNRTAEVRAGIATLEVLLTEPRRRFSVQAMDLLAEFVKENFEIEDLEGSINAAIRALQIGEDNGLRSRIRATLELPQSPKRPEWRYIPGFEELTYWGGGMLQSTFNRAVNGPSKASFYNVVIIGATVPNRYYSECVFRRCTILSTSVGRLRNNEFTNCNFSGAIIEDYQEEIDQNFRIRGGDNYYEFDNPPDIGRSFDWSGILTMVASDKGPD
ncbi:hypothetical protein [Ensifer adhaerens]|uniref:hypothetical protein n=1 Tax=Ensifer adhaerens TaxID=106592 RepID=UPI00131A2E41|nr:hypothetical protein [Ensifer adhaerens]